MKYAHKDKLILRLKGNKRCQQIAANRFAMQGKSFADIVNVCLYHQYVGQLSLQTAVEKIYSDIADEIIERKKLEANDDGKCDHAPMAVTLTNPRARKCRRCGKVIKWCKDKYLAVYEGVE